MTDPLTRTYYFDGELLSATTFIRDQRFVRDLNAYQNSNLFSAGVVADLTPSGQGTTTLTVGPGMAIDDAGNPLFVMSDLPLPLSAQTLSSGKTYYVLLQYSNSTTDGTPVSALQSQMTITDQPRLTLSDAGNAPPTKAGQGVILCSIQVDASGKLTQIGTDSASGRVAATLKLQAAGGGGSSSGGGGQQLRTAVPAPHKTQEAATATPVAGGPLHLGPGASRDAELSVGVDLSDKSGPSAALSVTASGGPGETGALRVLPRADGGAGPALSLTTTDREAWRVDRSGQGFALADPGLVRQREAPPDPATVLAAAEVASVVPDSSGVRRLAVIADKLESVAPELVAKGAGGELLVSYQGLVCVLIEALHGLEARLSMIEKAAMVEKGGERRP